MKQFDPTPWTRNKKQMAVYGKARRGQAIKPNIDRVQSCIEQLKERGIDITEDYGDWTMLAFSLASLGESGRGLFHELSRMHPKYDYDESEKKFNESLKNANGSISIGTFFKYCSDYNIKPTNLDVPTVHTSTDAIQNPEKDEILVDVLAVQKKILQRLNQEIDFIPPLLTHNGREIIWKNTINVIMGQKGSHKSRLSEGLCALFLNKTPGHSWIGFSKFDSNPQDYYVLHVDTERSIIDQYPFALRGIFKKAGFRKRPQDLDFLSLVMEPRGTCFEVLQAYLERKRSVVDLPIVVFIDVVSDLVGNFNNVYESLNFNDWLKLMINKYDLTFICVIHENPGLSNSKARGHLGTEIENKASTELRISLQKGNKKRPTELIQLEFPKVRDGRPPESVYLIWSDEEKGLVVATDEEIAFGKDAGKDKAAVSEIVEALPEILAEPLNHSDFAEVIKERFGCGISTAKNRISELMKMDPPIKGADSNVYRLRTKKDGKSTMYFLERIPETGSGEVSQS